MFASYGDSDDIVDWKLCDLYGVNSGDNNNNDKQVSIFRSVARCVRII